MFTGDLIHNLFSSGNVTSPNHPGNYPHGLDIKELITVKSGKILRLEFKHFAVYGSPSFCQAYDFVKITDGDGTTLMDNSCGYSDFDPSSSSFFQPPIITSLTNTVEIYFHTDDEIAASGWSLDWTALASGGCFIVTSPCLNFIAHHQIICATRDLLATVEALNVILSFRTKKIL